MEEGTIGLNRIGGEQEPAWERVDVLGVGIACVDQARALEAIGGWLDSGHSTYLCLTGVHGVMEARGDEAVHHALQGAGMDLPDGMPMVWAGRRAGSAEIERVYGPALMLAVCELAARRGWPVFFYGGQSGVADLLAARMAERFVGLEVAGTHTPPMREAGEREDPDVLELISGSGARVVFIGISTPKQELWMANHLPEISGSVVLIGVGAAFDIHAGLRSDAPAWIGRLGLHWLYRLAQEPRRLWRRYLSIIPRFLFAIFRQPPRLIGRGVDDQGR
ncbi:MAG: WecB/TagA/CpsF family glycosyltransferase [bacterium]